MTEYEYDDDNNVHKKLMPPMFLPKILEAELEQVVSSEHQGPQEQQLHVHQGAASRKHVNREETRPQPTGCF